MRIISFATHTPHQYDLANALYDFEFDLIGDWNWQNRPLPTNVRMIYNDYNIKDYDLAIGHVGGETEAIIPKDFDKIPLILISHGAGEPFVTGENKYDAIKIAESCKDYKVICCCNREMQEWQKQIAAT